MTVEKVKASRFICDGCGRTEIKGRRRRARPWLLRHRERHQFGGGQRQNQAERVRIALELFPPNLKASLESVDLFFGDPLFCGLHHNNNIAGKRRNGTPFTYKECLHYTQVHNQSHLAAYRRAPTVVVPPAVDFDTWDLCHEFGHVIDQRLSLPSESLAVAPITRYAATNPSEAFAEAVAALVATTDTRRFRSDSFSSWLRKNCPEFLVLFDALAEFNL